MICTDFISPNILHKAREPVFRNLFVMHMNLDHPSEFTFRNFPRCEERLENIRAMHETKKI